MKPHRLLVLIVVVCLLVVSAHDSSSIVQAQVPELTPSRVQAQLNAPLIPAYYLFQPRFYKEYGEKELNSTLYLQNPGEMMAPYSLDFYDCISGAHVNSPPPIWDIPSRATQVAGPGDFPDLDPGCYGLVIASPQDFGPYAGVVEDTWSGSGTDKLATHAGFAEEEAGSRLRFGPLLKDELTSTVHIWNSGGIDGPPGTVTVTARAYDASGLQIDLPSCTMAPYAQCTYDVSALTQLSKPFVGSLVIQSTGAVVGVMALDSSSGAVSEYRRPLVVGTAGTCLPRVLKHVNEGGAARSTALFVANTADQATNANLVFYDSAGVPVSAAGQSFTLKAQGSRYLKLAELAGLPNGTWSACASGDRPLVMEELTQPDIPPTLLASSGTRGVTRLGSTDSFAVTHLIRSDASYTAFSVQNPGTSMAEVALKYYDISGTPVHTDTVKLPPKGWARFDQSTQSGLGDGFVGSPVLSSNQPLVSLVDEYVPPPLKRLYLPLVLR